MVAGVGMGYIMVLSRPSRRCFVLSAALFRASDRHGTRTARAADGTPSDRTATATAWSVRPRDLVAKVLGSQRQTRLPEERPWEDASYLQELQRADGDLLVDFVAAYLSFWIYRAKSHRPPKSLRYGRAEQIDFTLHEMYHEPLRGFSARVAAVTAAFPGGLRVLFLVFKGTTDPVDFLADVSISPRYVPFRQALGDRQSFVHGTVYSAIEEFMNSEWEWLLDLAIQEHTSGVDRCVLSGHSLGGMYAKACLLDFFFVARARRALLPEHLEPAMGTKRGVGQIWGRLRAYARSARKRLQRLGHGRRAFARRSRWRRPAEHPLLREARCVTFGAPSICGTAPGAQPRQDLRSFFRARAVNYVHENDPVPCAYSNLDFERFVSVLIDGRLAPGFRRVARTWGQRFLTRPDVRRQWLDIAERFVELASVRLLTRGPWRAWTNLTEMSMEDHLMRSYLGCFTDLAAGRARLYSEDGRPIGPFGPFAEGQ